MQKTNILMQNIVSWIFIAHKGSCFYIFSYSIKLMLDLDSTNVYLTFTVDVKIELQISKVMFPINTENLLQTRPDLRI